MSFYESYINIDPLVAPLQRASCETRSLEKAFLHGSLSNQWRGVMHAELETKEFEGVPRGTID